jgi:hypothetical protein
MAIKASSTSDIQRLLAALDSTNDIDREAAIARLAIIGERAVVGLISGYERARDRRAREGVLRALESTCDPRALAIARDALGQGGEVALAAVGLLRGLLHSPQAATSAAALDSLMTVVLDTSREHRLRRAAAGAVDSVAAVRDQVAAALAHMPGGAPDRSDTEATWQDAVNGRLPDDPAALRAAADAEAPGAPLSVLQKMIDGLREREHASPERLAHEWRGMRGALHQALALRGSRVALYDLRESLAETSDPLPPSFLAALHAVGDASCLDGIATACEASADPRWRAQLREAFHAIMRREHLTRRSAALKRLASKRPAAFRELMG